MGRVKHTGGGLEFKKHSPEALCLVVGGDCSLEDFLSGTIVLFLWQGAIAYAQRALHFSMW
ncbi:MAG: hypothetical protein LBR29_07825, partial [Methylobacteriaceae bacterium]|nr:hypothetical protein [Methylobacteriaceae bacterium]